MTKPKTITFRPNALELIILEKLQAEYGFSENGRKFNTSDLVRFCIRQTGEDLFTDDEYKEILLHVSRF